MSDLEDIATRLFWWKSAQEALADPHRFLAQVMVYGTAEDVVTVRRHFEDADLRKVLADPPPGLFDPRSWAYWHVVFGLEPPELEMRFHARSALGSPEKGLRLLDELDKSE